MLALQIGFTAPTVSRAGATVAPVHAVAIASIDSFDSFTIMATDGTAQLWRDRPKRGPLTAALLSRWPTSVLIRDRFSNIC